MKSRCFLFILLIIILGAAACTPQASILTSLNGGFDVVDALGRTVHFDKPPERIVLTGKALFMIADAIYMFPQAGKRVVATGDINQGSGNFIAMIDPDYKNKAVLKSDAGPEQVAALNPDVVILKSYLAEKVGKPIEALKIPVVYIDFEIPEQYDRDINILGTLFQDPTRAGAVATFFKERVDRVQANLKGLSENQKPRTLLLYYSDKDGTIAFNVPPVSWMQTRLVEMAGGLPVWKDANPGNNWATVTLEQIAVWNADAIFIISYAKDPSEVVSALKSDQNWASLKAVKDGKLYAFAADLYSWDQPDPRWILGLTWLSGKLHGDLTKNTDIIAEARTFYQILFGLDPTFFDKNIQPTLKGDIP